MARKEWVGGAIASFLSLCAERALLHNRPRQTAHTTPLASQQSERQKLFHSIFASFKKMQQNTMKCPALINFEPFYI